MLCGKVKTNSSHSKDRFTDGEKKENDRFTSRVTYLEQETERLIARLQTSFTTSATLRQTSKDETNPLTVETEDISELIDEMMQILSPNYTSDADETKWDDKRSLQKEYEFTQDEEMTYGNFAATLSCSNDEKENLHAENDNLRKIISNNAKLIESLSSSYDQANSSVLSMVRLLHEKDQALYDCEEFMKMNNAANKLIVEKTKKQCNDQIHLLQEKLHKSDEQKMEMEKEMASTKLSVVEYKTALSEKQQQFAELARMLEGVNDSLKLVPSETSTSIYSRMVSTISELLNVVKTHGETRRELDECLPIPERDVKKSQVEVKKQTIITKSLSDRSAYLQDCLTKQIETIESLMTMKDEALKSVRDLTALVEEKDVALVEMSETLEMNNQANEKILSRINENHAREITEKELCIQNLLRIIQRQHFGESEHFRKLLKEKEDIQRELSSIKLEQTHKTIKSTKPFDFIGLKYGMSVLILSVLLLMGRNHFTV